MKNTYHKIREKLSLTNQGFLIVIAIGVTLLIASILFLTKPEPERTEPVPKSTLVNIYSATMSDEPVILTAYGVVQANREVTLRSEVSGRVIEQSENLVVGGLTKKDEILLRLDPRDYLIIIEQEKANLEKAEFEIQVEKGRQVVAKREWEQLAPSIKITELSEELALRKPHLREKKAALEAAKSKLEKAKLDYQRTVIRSPLNAIVIEESVETGDYITPQNEITQLVATDEFRVQVSVPVNKLEWIQIPGGKVTVIQDLGKGQSKKREGTILRLLGNLDPSGRMARILVTIEDPLGLKNLQYRQNPLLIGSYIRVEFEGPVLENIFVIPREAVREDNQVWIQTEDNTLDIRNINIVLRHKDVVYINKGLKEGEKIVISSLPLALPGMLLRSVETQELP